MKKLLELLGTILITSNVAGPLAVNKPNNNNDKIKNSLETLTRQKRQAPKGGKGKNKKDNLAKSSTTKPQNEQPSTSTTDNQAEFIKKEIALNENYSDNIQKMLKNFMKNNQIDPLRMINNEGIVTTDKFETLAKRKERDANLKIIEKLEKILELSKFDANKIRILVLTLKNKDNNKEIKLVINLDNFYVQGFINNQKQYFYFKEEKSLEQWNQEKKKNEDQLNEWNEIEKDIKSLDLEKLSKNENIIKEIDENKGNIKKQLGENHKENKEKINLLNQNLFDQINNKDLEDPSKLNELKQKVQTLNKEKIYLGQDQEEVNIYQKIQQIKQNALNLLKKVNVKSEDKKAYEEKIKNYQWDNVMINEIKEIIENDIIRIQHKKIKENQINKIVAKKYSIKENQQHKLNHTGSYQSKGLNAVNQNQNIIISQDTLNNAIANLSEVNNDNKQSQTTKNDLVQLLFVTSEAMRFGSYRKYFNYEKDDRQVEFKNIPTNVQGILDGKINSLIKWKEYEHQLIRGWIASSKDLEQKRKEIFKKLNERIIVSNFLSENYKELNEIFKASLKTNQNWETNVKLKIESIIKNYQNKEYINVILQYLENLFEASKDEIKFLKTGYKNILKFINTDHNYNLIRSVISEGNLDLLELIITKKSELINVNNNDLTFLQVAITNYKIDIVKWLLANGADVNEKGKYGTSPLYTASFKRHLKSVELLIKKAKEIYQEQPEEFKKFINKKTENGTTPLYVAVDRGCLDIVSLLLNNGAEVDTQDIEHAIPSPLHRAAHDGHLGIVKLLLDHGADVNVQDDTGAAPLHGAADKGQLAVVKLLLAHGAKVEKDNYHNQTPLCMATIMGHTKIVNLLDSFKKLKEQLEKSQDDTVKEQIKDKIKDLLKIKLSDFITQTELGEIENNSSQTILNAFIEKNKEIKNLSISPGQLYVKNKTDNSADIISPTPNYYPGTVTVKFTVGTLADSSGPSRNASGNNDGSAGPNENNDATADQGAGGSQSQGNNGIQQNNSDEPTNHNNLYDVPADNSCLFWSVATSYLLQVRKNIEEFRNRFIQLFGEENLKYLLHIHKLLQQYDLENNRNLNQLWYQDQTANNLVINFFRNRVVDYIQSNLDTIPNRDGELTFRSLIQDNNDIDTNYLEIMRQPSTWGGAPEIIAMSNLINTNISVNNNGSYQPINQNSNNNNIAIYYVELTKGSGIHNHYNFVLTPEENRTNHPIAINANQGNIPVADTTKRPDNLPPAAPKPDTKSIKLPVDDHAQRHTILSKNNEDDDANQGNIINAPEPTTTPLQKDEYHFVDKKTEEKSLKNDENLEINLIKNNHKIKIKQNVPVVNQPINTNMENLQTTATKAINKYNALSKEEKLKRLNEINRYYQTLSENDKKAFKEKLTNTGLVALSGGALTAYGTKMTVSGTGTAATTSVTNAEAMEMTPLLSTSTTESLAAAETITVAETAAVEGGVIAGETGTAAALAPETLGLSLVIGGLAIAGTWMYFAFHHHATSDIALPASIHHNVYDNIEKWYEFLAHDKLKIKINKNTWNEIKQNKNSQVNIIKIIKNKFVISDHSGWGGSITNEDFNTLVKVILLHFEQINGYFEILDNKNDGFVIITNTEGDWLGIE